ncbi:MAG: phosphotransferase, partial [Defluviitaleaceae bacterium]|nr:phosphotransferase [Defluviitaleaceae bacterium]
AQNDNCTFSVCHPELAKGLENSSPAAQNDNFTFSVCHPELAKGLENSSPAAQNDNCTLHNDACPLPKHICEMIIETDKNSESLWEKIETLPVVLCHKDFWITNIIYTDEKIFLLDWDTTGFGYLGEDVAQLISDDIDAEKMHEYCRACVPAYLKGFNEHSGIPQVNDLHLRDRIIMSLGYRYVENYKFAETEEERETSLNLLQKIYEL